MKVADLSERGENKGFLGTLPLGIKDAGKFVVDGEVNPQMQIYYRNITLFLKAVFFIKDPERLTSLCGGFCFIYINYYFCHD